MIIQDVTLIVLMVVATLMVLADGARLFVSEQRAEFPRPVYRGQLGLHRPARPK